VHNVIIENGEGENQSFVCS